MRSIVLLLLVLLVSACARPPATMVLSSTLIPQEQRATHSGTIDLQVIDYRNYRHILQLNTGGEQQNLISSSQQPKLIVNEALEQHLSQQGYQLSPTAQTMVTVEIEQMLISLNQQSLKYNTNNNIVLKVIVSSGNKKLTKKFTTKGQSYGLLTADIAVLERIFNQQLGELISKITNDPQVQQYLTNNLD